MKKSILIVAAISFFSLNAMSQKDYISPVFSYSFGLGKSDIMMQNEKAFIDYDTVTYQYTYKNQGFSFGQGYHLGLAYGHNFGDHIGLEIVAGYYNAVPRSVQLTTYFQYVFFPSIDCKMTQDQKYSLKSVNLSPAIRMSPGWEKWNPYLSCGVNISCIFLREETDVVIVNTVPGYLPREQYYYLEKYDPVFTAGAFCGLGLEFTCDKLFNPFIETEFSYLLYRPKRSEIVECTYQDKDQMSSLSRNERYTEYTDTYSDLQLAAGNPGKELSFSIPLHSISVTAGIRIKLTGRIRK
jgi:hypothetical protein